jgi:hypothetical protein
VGTRAREAGAEEGAGVRARVRVGRMRVRVRARAGGADEGACARDHACTAVTPACCVNSTCPVTPSMAIVATAYVFLPRYTGAPPATHTEHDLGHLRARTPMRAIGAPMTGQAWALACVRARVHPEKAAEREGKRGLHRDHLRDGGAVALARVEPLRALCTDRPERPRCGRDE